MFIEQSLASAIFQGFGKLNLEEKKALENTTSTIMFKKSFAGKMWEQSVRIQKVGN